MPPWLIALYCLHVGTALFWMGSCFLVAQAKGKGAERQYRPQAIAMTLTFLVGAYLWWKLHWPLMGRMEMVLGLGVLCAIIASGVHGALVGGSLRKLRKGALTDDEARRRITKGQRIVAGLTAIALLCMVGSYHVGR